MPTNESSRAYDMEGATADRVANQRWVTPGVLFALVGCALLLGLYLRRPDGFIHPQFFAEDGTVFFKQALLQGPSAVFLRYGGYLCLYQRLVALFGQAFPVRWLPAIYSAGSVGAFLLVGARCLSRRLPFPPSTRVFMAVALVFAPAQDEAFMTLTNSQWSLALGLALVLISSEAATVLQKVCDITLALLAGLTGPFSILILPFFIVRFAVARSRFTAVLAGIILACAVVQLPSLAVNKPGGGHEPILEFVRAFDSLPGHMFGGSFGRPAPTTPILAWAIAFFSFLLLLGLASAIVRFGAWEALALLAVGGTILFSTLWAYRLAPSTLTWGANRYFYIPTVTLTWVFLILRQRLPVACILALAVGACAFAEDHEYTKYVDYHWSDAVSCLDLKQACRIPINPPGWFVELGP